MCVYLRCVWIYVCIWEGGQPCAGGQQVKNSPPPPHPTRPPHQLPHQAPPTPPDPDTGSGRVVWRIVFETFFCGEFHKASNSPIHSLTPFFYGEKHMKIMFF